MQCFHWLEPHELAMPKGKDSRKWALVLLDENPTKTSFTS